MYLFIYSLYHSAMYLCPKSLNHATCPPHVIKGSANKSPISCRYRNRAIFPVPLLYSPSSHPLLAAAGDGSSYLHPCVGYCSGAGGGLLVGKHSGLGDPPMCRCDWWRNRQGCVQPSVRKDSASWSLSVPTKEEEGNLHRINGPLFTTHAPICRKLKAHKIHRSDTEHLLCLQTISASVTHYNNSGNRC